ncbi:S41 family peptidase [Pedobacter montanisoli]|uniref:S41 family peptidase n=1 Tax=Pedobacter montanisoli TaxID=2923277 RepID=A0ABS9ZZT1_9SPHI|nr:S41 family peptidase [Pedobacter montanisoli]MCJ0743819.1 S41 family peptidase [Pedobacter montanisoli]
MKTIKINFVLILLVLLSFSTKSQQLRVLTPIQMTNDVDTLVRFLEETHLNPYYKYSKENFVKDVALIKKGLTKHLTVIDFYLKIEPLLAKLQDGHTDLPVPKELYNLQDPYELPYVFILSTKAPYIICKMSKANLPSLIPINSEIISINNMPAKRIVEDIVNLNTGETPDFRAEFGARNLSFYLENLYKTNGNYKVKYKFGSQIKLIEIEGIKQKKLSEIVNKIDLKTSKGNNEKSNFDFEVVNNVAIINFRKFDWNGFRKFADSAFSVIKNNKINNLIINLIDNGGGESEVGDEFLQYLLSKPFKQYNKVVIKNSQLYKARLKKNIGTKKPDKEELEFLNQKNGTVDTFYVDSNKIKENSFRYNGNVYLLVNSQTYSSAADFAQCFKYYKRGLIIGEETGGLIKSFGDIVTTHLPNSNLRFTISSTLYYNVGVDEEDFCGVIPDFYSTSDKALKKAFEIIENQK